MADNTHPGHFPGRGRTALILAILLGLTWGINPASALTPTDAEAPPNSPPAGGITLPRTDGDGPGPKPLAFTPEERQRLFIESQRACAGPCVTPFGAQLGVADGAEARSNCASTCLHLEYSYLDPHSGEISVHRQNPDPERFRYIGVTYQCVEYARKWWMKNRNLTFGDVDGAYDILYLTEGENIHTRDPVPLSRSLNGTARRPPQRGDLVIYAPDRSDPDWRHGHVAVVVAVDLDQGRVALAEENYDNRPWQNPQAFARQIQLFEVGGRYTLVDVPPSAHRNAKGGRIAGWVYPPAAP